MKKIFIACLTLVFSSNIFAQTLIEAQKEIDNESYYKAQKTLFKLLKDPMAPKGEVYYYLGNAYLKDENVDSAKIFYKLSINPETKTPLGLVAAGRLALLNKNAAEAKLQFDAATKLTKQKSATVFYEIGDAYFSPKIIDLKLAIINFETAYSLDNKNTTNLLALGDAYLENASTDNTMGGKAMSKYQAASDVNKQLPLALIKEGRLSMRGRIYEQAIEAFNKALAIDPNYAIVHKELFEAYYYTNQYDKMKASIEKYIALSPGDNQARTNYAALLFQAKDYAKAIEESKTGLQNDPNNYVFHRIIAFANFELKKYKEAADASKAFWAIPVKKIKDIDYVYSARIASQVNDTTAALNYFITALANDSANCDLLGEYGKVLFQSKRFAQAIAQYDIKKQRCGSLSSLETFYLGRTYYSTNDFVMADTTFGDFIRRNPTSPDGYWWRARTNLQMGKPENYSAYPYYQKYIDIAGTDEAKYKKNLAEAYLYAGVYNFEKLNNKTQAKTFIAKSLELDPNNSLATEYMKQF